MCLVETHACTSFLAINAPERHTPHYGVSTHKGYAGDFTCGRVFLTMSSSPAWTAHANEALSLSLGLSFPPSSSPLQPSPRTREDKPSLWSQE